MKRIQNSPLAHLFLLLLLFSFTSLACQLGAALEATPTPRVRDTDEGCQIQAKIRQLEALLEAYREGLIKEQ